MIKSRNGGLNFYDAIKLHAKVTYQKIVTDYDCECILEDSYGGQSVASMVIKHLDIKCGRCGTVVEEETELDYPYVCQECDENMFSIECVPYMRKW